MSGSWGGSGEDRERDLDVPPDAGCDSRMIHDSKNPTGRGTFFDALAGRRSPAFAQGPPLELLGALRSPSTGRQPGACSSPPRVYGAPLAAPSSAFC